MVSDHHPRTLLHAYPGLAPGGRSFYAKHEHHSPIRSFKGRGPLYAFSRLDEDERRRGVVSASTGNHGQGIGWAGRTFGVATTVFTPRSTPQVKKRAMRAQGVELIEIDGNLEEAARQAHELADAEGRVFIEDGDHAGLMAGAASIGFEILEEVPRPEILVVPVGGANLIAAVSLVVRELSPRTRIVGVQSEAAPAVHDSLLAGEVRTGSCETMAGGLATSVPGVLSFSVIKDTVNEICLVSEDELCAATLRMLDLTGQLLEPAAAAPLAAVERYGAEWGPGGVVAILSGGNIALDQLRDLLVGADPGASESPPELKSPAGIADDLRE